MFGYKETHKYIVGDIVRRKYWFIEDSSSIRNNLELHPSGRNEGPTTVVVVVVVEHSEERANVAILEASLSWNETIMHNVEKLMNNVRNSLYRVKKLRNPIVLQVFDYSEKKSVEDGALNCL